MPPPEPGWLAARVMALLAHYYQPEQSEAMSALVAGDWIDALEHFPQDGIEHACKSYLQSQPSRRPTIADIRNRVVAYMDVRAKPIPRPEPKRLAAPERKPVDAEQAQRILHQNGYTEAKFDLVKRFPSAPSMQAIEEVADKQQKPHWAETADPDGPEMRALRAARDANPLIQAARAAQKESEEVRRVGL